MRARSTGIIKKIRENSILLIVGTLLTLTLGVILSSVSVNIEIGYSGVQFLHFYNLTPDPTVATFPVEIMNMAQFDFPGVKNYYLLNVKIDDNSINSIAYIKDDLLGIKYFHEEKFNLGHIPVSGKDAHLIYIKNVDEQEGTVYYTIQVYGNIFGFPILLKELKEDFVWAEVKSLPLPTLAELSAFIPKNEALALVSPP